MPKYIKAEALIDDLIELAKVNKGTYHEEGFKNAITVVEMQDPANVVEVVRCKDCRFWITETEPIGIECEPGETAHYCELGGIWRSGDFCKYGKRKGDPDVTH